MAADTGVVTIPYSDINRGNLLEGSAHEQEILEAVRVLEREKGISSEQADGRARGCPALRLQEDSPAPPGTRAWTWTARRGDFLVFELILPPELEEQLLTRRGRAEEPTVDPETGEMREPEEPEIDLEQLAEYQDQIDERDVTPTTSAASPRRPPSR